MLPTSPRSSVRSMCSSCSAPLSTTATRVSWGDQLMRMSCMNPGEAFRALSEADASLSQQSCRLELGPSDALHIAARRLAGALVLQGFGILAGIGQQQAVRHADLVEQLAAARALRSQVDEGHSR